MIPLPNNIPVGADWVLKCPRVDGFRPGGAQPVQEVIYKTTAVGLQVVQWAYARITPAHLNTGTDTNTAMRQWVQNEVGYPTDDAGHIVGKALGGYGTVQWNIFPQSSNFNRGAYSHFIEDLHRKAAANQLTIEVWYEFEFGPQVNNIPHVNPERQLTRAIRFRYLAQLSNGITISNDLENPITV